MEEKNGRERLEKCICTTWLCMYVENLKELYGISNKNMEIYIDYI